MYRDRLKSRTCRVRECCRQLKALKCQAVSKSRNKIHQTWCTDFSRSLYIFPILIVYCQGRGIHSPRLLHAPPREIICSFTNTKVEWGQGFLLSKSSEIVSVFPLVFLLPWAWLLDRFGESGKQQSKQERRRVRRLASFLRSLPPPLSVLPAPLLQV